jgi:GGDEF domain-containing protein
MGGEEFLVVLPGAELTNGEAIAGQLRGAIATAFPGGLRVTGSLGVSAEHGDAVDLALTRLLVQWPVNRP